MHYKTFHLPLLKAAGSDAARGMIVGYASVFGLTDLQGDIVARGAFRNSLAGWRAIKQAPALLWQHAPTAVAGKWLELKEDTIGLFVRGRLDLKTAQGMKAWQAIKIGAVNGLSIGYRVVQSQADAARRARILTAIALEEISLVTVPANPAARISQLKSMQSTTVKEPTWI